MADDSDRNEAPTPHRRQEARNRGQVVKSQDLSAAVLVLTGLLMLDITGTALLGRLAHLTRFCLGGGDPTPEANSLGALFKAALIEGSYAVLPFMGVIFVVSGIVLLLQVGWLLTVEPIKPDINKINPISGFKKIFSLNMVTQSGINIAKLVVVGAVVYWTIAGELQRIIFSASMSLLEMIGLAVDVFFSLGIRVSVALIILGIIDWFYQRHKHEKQIKMTKQEVKDELKRMDGDQLLKRRRRETQMKLAMQNMRRQVPQADVVVTNPTHIAVAIKYDPKTMSAPRVLAKGEGHLAQRIRKIAEDAGIPIVERKPLARSLFRMCEIGQEVPQELYKAVAEVLAYVYQLSGQRPTAA